MLLPPTHGRYALSSLPYVLGDAMDHGQNQGMPLTSLMHWDRDGELCSEDLDQLLARLLAQELSEPKQDQTSANKRRDFSSTHARNADQLKTTGEQVSQLATMPRTI